MEGLSTYHFAASPVSVHWKSRRRIESLIMKLDEHYMLKDRTWLVGSSSALPSNLGMYEGSSVRIEGQPASWCIGSLINWLKSKRLNPGRKGSVGAIGMVLEMVSLDVTSRVEPELTPGWVPAPTVGPDMMKVCGEGGSESDEPE